jgi:hypothetical protein
MASFDYAKAHADGVSDADIADYLDSEAKAGRPLQVVNFAPGGAPAVPVGPKVPPPPANARSVASDVLRASGAATNPSFPGLANFAYQNAPDILGSAGYLMGGPPGGGAGGALGALLQHGIEAPGVAMGLDTGRQIPLGGSVLAQALLHGALPFGAEALMSTPVGQVAERGGQAVAGKLGKLIGRKALGPVGDAMDIADILRGAKNPAALPPGIQPLGAALEPAGSIGAPGAAVSAIPSDLPPGVAGRIIPGDTGPVAEPAVPEGQHLPATRQPTLHLKN